MTIARIVAFALALCACVAFSQEGTKDVLIVVVFDRTTARVPGAHIAATNQATGAWIDVVADPSGEAKLNLNAGRYALRVQAPGFQLYEEKEIEVKGETVKYATLLIDNVGQEPRFPQELIIPLEHPAQAMEIPLIPMQQFLSRDKPLRRRSHWF